ALEHEKHVAKYKIDRYSAICKGFEKKFGSGSGYIRKRLEAGGIVKHSDFIDSYTAKSELDHWNRKLEILSGISFS
ncbi:MAG: hypothetical protein GX120_11095, partial [Methanosarcina mazei]|nr:hypothetical protein [Methanosarcina mazei]